MTSTESSLRLDILTEPASLPKPKCDELIDAFVELSYQTTGGDDWQSYRPAIEGWREYYNAVGARPQDYDRLVLIYDGDLLVHFTGVTRFRLGPSLDFTWMRSSMTLRKHHGGGMLKMAILSVFSPEWLRELGETCFVVRTANPIVYEATRNLSLGLAASHNLSFTWYPEINIAGELDPVPDGIRDLAWRVAKKTCPGCDFIRETFVNKGYFKRFAPLYREPAFPCDNAATKKYFESVVDYSNQDGILVLIHMRPRHAMDGGSGANDWLDRVNRARHERDSADE